MKSYLEHERNCVSFASRKITEFTKSNFGAARDIGILKADQSVIAQTLDSAFTTAGLNFMTWDKIYSLFPVATFVEKTSCCRAPPSEDLNKHLRSESAADYRLLAWIGRVPARDHWVRDRWIGDRFTWANELDTTGVTPPADVSLCIEKTTSALRKTSRTPPGMINISYYEMRKLTIIKSPVLRHKYTVLALDGYTTGLCERLTELTVLGLGKNPKA